jgi:carboxylesterase
MKLQEIQKKIRDERTLLAGNRSFFLKPKRASRGSILLLHGFSASPHEVREAGLHLQAQGYTVYAPRLAGHGVGQPDFDSKGMKDWIADAETAYDCLRQDGKKLILIGHSGGGLLVTMLAQKYQREIACLILAAPAFRLADPMAPWSLIPWVRWFRPTLHFKAVHPDSKYWTLSYSSSRIAELVRLGRLAAKDSLGLRLPILMLQSRGDDLVSSRFNERIFQQLPSRDKKLLVYEAAHEHNVLHHYNLLQKKIFNWIDAFLKTHPVK